MNNTNVIGLDGMPLNASCDNQEGGYIALGYNGNCSYVYSRIQERVVGIRPTHMNEMNLKTICGADWCEKNWTEFHPVKEEMFFNHKALATQVIRDCQAAGMFVETQERKLGVWASQDGGSLYINGDTLWRNDGVEIKRGFIDGKVYPKCGGVGFNAETEIATQEDIDRVMASFNSYEWQGEMVPEMLLGWFVCALMPTALERRPHIYFTGPAGIGKTTILDTMNYLLGPLAFKSSGPQRMAGLYQSLMNTPRAVILDEFEADHANRGWAETLEIARISYSLPEDDHGIVRGSPTGTAKSYRFYAPFLAAGIVPGKFQAADLSRWVIVEAKGRKPGAEATRISEREARAIGPRLAALAVRRWSVLQASLETIRETIQLRGGDARLADTVGPLMAGYWALVSDKPATADDAATLVGLCGLAKHLKQREETDEVRCQEALFSKVLTLPMVDGEFLVRRPMSVGEAVQTICENPMDTLELQQRLSQYGLRVKALDGQWKVMVANSPEHQELRKLFQGTKWQYGGWGVTLRRLPGGAEGTQRLGAGNKASKVTVFDVPKEFLSANDDTETLAA